MTVATRAQLLSRGLRLEYLTVGWNIAEGVIAVGAGLVAGSISRPSPSGSIASSRRSRGAILLWRLRAEAVGGADEERIEHVEHRARGLVGVSFAILAGLRGVRGHPDARRGRSTRCVLGRDRAHGGLDRGHALARAREARGEALGSRALVADSHQTYACWYLSVTTLAGLVLNAALCLWWADPVAALVIAVFLVREAREAWEGEEVPDW